MFHLDFTNFGLKSIAKGCQRISGPESSETAVSEDMIREKYLKICNLENPLHFMTVWTARSYIAKSHLIEHHFRYSDASVNQTEARRNAAMAYALEMLEADTKLMTSPLTRQFHWMIEIYFLFPAYIQVVQDLKRRPMHEQARQAWQSITDNYRARFGSRRNDGPFSSVFGQIVLQAWEARELSHPQSGESLIAPGIVTSTKDNLARTAADAGKPKSPQSNITTDKYATDSLVPFGTDFRIDRRPASLGGQSNHTSIRSDGYSEMPGLPPLNVNGFQSNWSAMELDLDFSGGTYSMDLFNA